MRSDDKKVARFLERMGITYPSFGCAPDIFTQLFKGGQVLIPLSFIVDRQGRITEVLTGWSDQAEARARRLLTAGRPAKP